MSIHLVILTSKQITDSIKKCTISPLFAVAQIN